MASCSIDVVAQLVGEQTAATSQFAADGVKVCLDTRNYVLPMLAGSKREVT